MSDTPRSEHLLAALEGLLEALVMGGISMDDLQALADGKMMLTPALMAKPTPMSEQAFQDMMEQHICRNGRGPVLAVDNESIT